MKTVFIVAALVIIVLVLKACISGNTGANNSTSPTSNKKSKTIKENDKFIVVSRVGYGDIIKALMAFSKTYSNDAYPVVLRLSQVSTDTFVVTFPYDIDFVTFCFAVNFLKYPTDIKWESSVKAWATAKPGEEWITDKMVNKKIMLFLAEDDKEYDNVFLTTQDNIGYKMGFAYGEEKQLLITAKEDYVEPTIKYQDIQQLKFEDFEY